MTGASVTDGAPRQVQRIASDVALAVPAIRTRSKPVESRAREMRAEIPRLLREPTAAAWPHAPPGCCVPELRPDPRRDETRCAV